MSKFCTHCGNLLGEDVRFCTRCGHHIVPPKKKIPLWLVLALSGSALLVLLVVVGLGVWKIGEITGYWNARALDKAASAWSKQSDFEAEQREISQTLDLLAAALSAGDIPSALTYFHEDVQDEYTALLYENQSRLTELADIIRSNQITFLSTKNDYYFADKTAILTAGVPNSAPASPGTVSISMVKTENGWVVYTLR